MQFKYLISVAVLLTLTVSLPAVSLRLSHQNLKANMITPTRRVKMESFNSQVLPEQEPTMETLKAKVVNYFKEIFDNLQINYSSVGLLS